MAHINYDHDSWGWIMVAATFVNCFLIFGQLKALGVLLIPMTDDFVSDLWLIGWVVVLYSTGFYCFGPVAGAFSRMFGSRPMMILGGLMNTVGIILASISPTVSLLAVFIIGLSGIGCAFPYCISFAVMASYFKDKYPLALGISTMGIPLGVMAYGPMTQVLLDTYGWRGAMLILGGISFHAVACGVLVRRDPSSIAADTDRYQEVSIGDEERNNQEEGEAHVSDTSDCARGFPGHCEMAPSKCCLDFIAAFDFKLLADVKFVLLIIGRCTATFAYNAWLVYMVSHGWIYEWTGSFITSFFVYSGLTLLSIPVFIIEAIYAKQSAR
ncbi:monocarboxylate transporter 13-like [Acanthaster planci]|uniref:Monocarboxylate transporter 13-like n=1 Tax=Acanthaster planci TaxID=133434 RepID=A0A8B7Y7X0_ACAPL|nr:monocarboxylate transporter 13-like [Acanthaster planci]